MNNNLILIPVFFSGALFGAFFFGGLWWTVQKGLKSEWPAVCFLGSLLLRTVSILVGFYVVSRGEWLKLAVCLIGFMVARFMIITRIDRTPVDERIRSETEAPSAY